jgi:hypothetical protein
MGEHMGWIAAYVLFIPLIGGCVWVVAQTIKNRRARFQKLQKIQRRLSELEDASQHADVDPKSDIAKTAK